MSRLAGIATTQLDGWSPQSENLFSHLEPFFVFREGIASLWAGLSSGAVERRGADSEVVS